MLTYKYFNSMLVHHSKKYKYRYRILFTNIGELYVDSTTSPYNAIKRRHDRD
jgi:hypothetical protein